MCGVSRGDGNESLLDIAAKRAVRFHSQLRALFEWNDEPIVERIGCGLTGQGIRRLLQSPLQSLAVRVFEIYPSNPIRFLYFCMFNVVT